ncbi:MAG: hypothetical protein D5S00_08870 [Tindallia sp. MSAO_Bac2]|nr:MAG: hypothetical protein D5S00_08870 [Tindallia sp. MSAO_Bac2]
MKKTVLILSLVAMMLVSMIPVSAETTPGQDYWNEMKAIYEEWEAMESESTIELQLSIPDVIEQTFNISVTAESDMETFSSYMVIEVETDDPEMVIPTIELYTEGADFYLNREFVMFLAEMAEMEEMLAFEEDFVMLQDNQTDFQLDSGFLVQILEYLEGMDLEFELDMTFEDGTYHLSMGSDEMIDLLDAYLVYVMTNMDQMAMMMGLPEEELDLTEEELAEMMEMYEMFVAPMLEQVRVYIAGSTYEQSTVFEEGFYEEVATLNLTTPFGDVYMLMESSATKLDEVEIELPTSVKIITEEDLTNWMLSGMTAEQEARSLVAVIDVDADLAVQMGEYDVFEHETTIEISAEGRSYMPTSLAVEMFGLDMEPADEMMAIRSLENYGYIVEWDAHTRTIYVLEDQAL